MTPADFATTKSLRDHLERAVTGKLTVGSGRSAASVYLMNGQLMGAETAMDASRILRRLSVERAIDEQRASELLIAAQDGESIYGALFEESGGPVLEKVLTERFEDGLTEWLASDEEPEFTSMAAVFIDNLQMGVDAPAVIARALDTIEAAESFPEAGILAAGSGMPKGKRELMVRALLRSPTSVEDMLDMLPLEPWAAKATIASMIERGALRVETPEPAPVPEPAPEPQFDPEADVPTEMVHREEEDAETEMVEPEETEQIEPYPDRAGPNYALGATELEDDLMGAFEEPDAPAPEVDADFAGAFDDADEIEDLHTADVEPLQSVDTEPVSPESNAVAAAFDLPEVDDEFMGAFEEDSDQGLEPAIDPTFDGAFEDAGDSPVADPEVPVGFDPGEDLDAEVVSAFNDANEFRGGAKDAGHFVTETHNLDKVSLDGDVDEDLEFEAEEVPSQTFGAPRMSEDEAQRKVEVANSILEVIAEEYDKAQGSGAGRAAVQLLVDGSPLAYVPLFKDVTANGKGGLSHFEVLRNLYNRPPTEHRRLLHQGLKNLIDRGMSIAADELPDESVDAVLESAAGLSQRLGF